MRKKELESARRSFTGGASTQTLRTSVQRDLEPVRDAHDLAQQFLTKIEQMLANVEHDDKPYKAIKELSGAFKDAASTLSAMREEARASIAHARQSASSTSSTSSTHQHTLPAAPTLPAARPAPTFTPADVDVREAAVPAQLNGCAVLVPASALPPLLDEPAEQDTPNEPRVVVL